MRPPVGDLLERFYVGVVDLVAVVIDNADSSQS